MQTREWVLKRNCSLSPRQFALSYAILFLMSFAVSGAFLLLYGMWHVLAYATVEMAGVALAFFHYARHATDHEHIALTEACLLVEQVLADRTHQIRLDPHWTRVVPAKGRHDLVSLEAQGMKIKVGRFVPEAKRYKFAQELRQELQSRLPVRAID